MVPKEFRKNLCVIAGWVTLLEALVWGGLSIYWVGTYNCSWSYFYTKNGPNTWSMLYLTYFMGSCRGSKSAQDLGFMLSPPSDPAKHLDIWLWIYILFSVAWIPACILLTVAASVEVRGRQGALLYYPWIILSSVFIIVDFAGAIYHFIDVLHSTTPDAYASLTGSKSWSFLTSASSEGIITWLPSMLITLFFCRFIVLWLINLFFLIGVYWGCNAVSLYTTKYLQSSLMPEENKKSWKTRFYQGPDPSLFEQMGHTNEQSSRANNQAGSHPRDSNSEQRAEDQTAMRYRVEEVRAPAADLEQERGRRSPFKPGVFDYSGRPVHSDSHREQWRDNNNAPPIASGVQVPPELNKFEPFSYIAGDQPQLMKRPVSRSNSRGDQPAIPRPDYSLTEKRAASLEYVPNRFRVPAPKRPQSQSFDSAGRPIPSKVPPAPPKKPAVYPRSIPEDLEMRYITQQAVTQPQPHYTRQASAQNNNYNINKLY